MSYRLSIQGPWNTHVALMVLIMWLVCWFLKSQIDHSFITLFSKNNIFIYVLRLRVSLSKFLLCYKCHPVLHTYPNTPPPPFVNFVSFFWNVSVCLLKVSLTLIIRYYAYSYFFTVDSIYPRVILFGLNSTII